MSKHTPGPWKIEENNWSPMRIETENGVVIGEVYCESVWNEFREAVLDPAEEQLANANLIAAAPELLKALGGVLSNIESEYGISLDSIVNETTEAALIEAHEAINKAEGKV